MRARKAIGRTAGRVIGRTVGRAPVRQALAVARLELHCALRSRRTIAAAVILAALLALGHWQYWATAPPRPEDDRLFGYAFLLAAMLAVRPGFAADRRAAFDEYLVANFATPGRYAAGKLAATATVLALLGTYGFVAALALSAGDAVYASWHAALFTLVVWLFLPAVVLVELGMDTDLPAVVTAVLATVALVLASVFGRAEAALGVLGLRVARGEFATLAPLAVRGATVVPALLVLVALAHSPRRRRSPGDRVAARVVQYWRRRRGRYSRS